MSNAKLSKPKTLGGPKDRAHITVRQMIADQRALAEHEARIAAEEKRQDHTETAKDAEDQAAFFTAVADSIEQGTFPQIEARIKEKAKTERETAEKAARALQPAGARA